MNGQCMDGVLVVGGCDKNMPAGAMAMARMNVPGIYVYAGDTSFVYLASSPLV